MGSWRRELDFHKESQRLRGIEEERQASLGFVSACPGKNLFAARHSCGVRAERDFFPFGQASTI